MYTSFFLDTINNIFLIAFVCHQQSNFLFEINFNCYNNAIMVACVIAIKFLTLTRAPMCVCMCKSVKYSQWYNFIYKTQIITNCN